MRSVFWRQRRLTHHENTPVSILLTTTAALAFFTLPSVTQLPLVGQIYIRHKRWSYTCVRLKKKEFVESTFAYIDRHSRWCVERIVIELWKMMVIELWKMMVIELWKMPKTAQNGKAQSPASVSASTWWRLRILHTCIFLLILGGSSFLYLLTYLYHCLTFTTSPVDNYLTKHWVSGHIITLY